LAFFFGLPKLLVGHLLAINSLYLEWQLGKSLGGPIRVPEGARTGLVEVDFG
jgi:hypothetical protein